MLLLDLALVAHLVPLHAATRMELYQLLPPLKDNLGIVLIKYAIPVVSVDSTTTLSTKPVNNAHSAQLLAPTTMPPASTPLWELLLVIIGTLLHKPAIATLASI